MPESTAHFDQYTAPGLIAVSTEGFKRYPKTWQEFFHIRSSGRAYEQTGYVSGYPHATVKPEGSPVNYGERIQGPVKTWTHVSWALGARITYEAIKDVKYGIMKSIMRDLGVAAASTRHVLAIRMLMHLENTTHHVAGDGKAICATDHDKLGGGTYSNRFAVAATPSQASLEAAIRQFEMVTDDQHKRWDQKAKAVWCGPRWEFTMEKLLGSEYEPESANNAVNAVKRRRKLKIIVDPEITDDRWGLMGEKDKDVGMIWFDREKPSITRSDDPETKDVRFIMFMRQCLECNRPHQIFLSQW